MNSGPHSTPPDPFSAAKVREQVKPPRFVRWGFYWDLPIGFGKVLIFDFGWAHSQWIGNLGWRRSRGSSGWRFRVAWRLAPLCRPLPRRWRSAIRRWGVCDA
jgi:hypothetical protein